MSRMDRVNQQLKRVIGQIIHRELSDPRLEFVSITHVDTSKDLRNAHVYFSVLGDADQAAFAQEGLDSARGMIKRFIGREVNLRYTPDLIFSYDESIEKGIRIESTIQEINDDIQNNH